MDNAHIVFLELFIGMINSRIGVFVCALILILCIVNLILEVFYDKNK